MNFTKMHGLGNDFIVIAGERDLPPDVSERAVRLCNRYFGIGADGLVYILPSERADYRMRIINSDGTEAEQCGNAIRCVAKYIFDHGMLDRTAGTSGQTGEACELTVETIGAGVQKVRVLAENGRARSVRVDMGEPVLRPADVPALVDGVQAVDLPIETDGRGFRFTAVSMGNPHCVIFVDNAPGFPLAEWGPQLEKHPLFPNKTNVEFATVRSRDHVDMRVWERGAGPTLACGTGACATMVASVLNGHTDRQAVVSLKGGDLFIEWDEEDNHVYMTGPAEEVYTGSLL
ncbi:diaminopimelate epimerase [Paenibacillus sp. J31TS4]|uniref:diaminopimelate epimerase n=1 Tax=Paenibacillus sp. J31TS4 TaxID=2807195 RepID=UPI001B295E49|nr:diaminopimelate epimerase [Paenibacillus sp. J31TS4]GIP36725.1 diaminopimelate epimerase [Paenibacillus sp. J31TS4]